MNDVKLTQDKSAAGLRKIAVIILRLSVASLIAAIIGVYFDWFHWSWIVVALADLFLGYIADTVLIALANMSDKIDHMVELSEKKEGK